MQRGPFAALLALYAAAAPRGAAGALSACQGHPVSQCGAVFTKEDCSAAHEINPALPGEGHGCMWYDAFQPAKCVTASQCLSARCGIFCNTEGDCAGGPDGCTACVESGAHRTCARPPRTPAPPPPPPPVCDAACAVDADCSGAAQCGECIAGRCGSGCSQPCGGDRDCRDALCGLCVAGACRGHRNSTCGGACGSNADCGRDPTRCGTCAGGVCANKCGGPCGADSDCHQPGNNCTRCGINGQCAAPRRPCGSACVVDDDCGVWGPSGFECSQCIRGACGSGCGFPCSADSECASRGCGGCKNNGTHPWAGPGTCVPR